MSPLPRLELRGITKRFPGVLANDDVSLAVAPGEIHALLGENGAGKSTLVKIIYGVLHADAGEMLWNGQPVAVASPHAARALGIGMVFQHFSLFDAMTVLENVALGVGKAAGGDLRALAARLRRVSEAYGLPLDPDREVHTLSVGERQRIEIVRCLLQDPKLVIMDEPTSVLTPQEADRLFETLRALARDGCSILYISHKLREIEALCDRATILRGGRVVAECDPRTTSARSMAQLMIGSDLRTPARRKGGPATGAARLEVDGLTLPSPEPFGTGLRDVRLQVRAGEIFGVAGVAGNGQKELLLAISGERTAPRAGSVRIDGRSVGRMGAAGRRGLGLCCLPEERNGHAAVGDLTLADNGVLSAHQRMKLVQGGIILAGAARSFARRVIADYAVKAAGPEATAGSLSGGNLQKFVVGREILQAPGVLAVSQPTWGVDAGAAAAIHQALLDLAAAGTAILVISQDLDELLMLTDRLAVINGGALSRVLVTADASIDEIGLLMGGLHGLEVAPPAKVSDAA